MTVNVLNGAPILNQLDGQWMKMAAFLLFKLSKDSAVSITNRDIEAFSKSELVLVTHGRQDSVEFKLVTPDEAQRLARHDLQQRSGA